VNASTSEVNDQMTRLATLAQQLAGMAQQMNILVND
jgi:hypothetical protein